MNNSLPTHLAIIMDGNGRWAKKRFLPRLSGHKNSVETVRGIVKACAQKGIPYLSLFAFSTELNMGIFIVAGLLAFIIATFTISFKSFQAASVNPVKTLNEE